MKKSINPASDPLEHKLRDSLRHQAEAMHTEPQTFWARIAQRFSTHKSTDC